MLNKFKKQMKNEKGLTLIELLAVIVILAIIAAIAVPAIGNVISNSKQKSFLADASNILAGAKIAVIDGACGSPDAATVTCDNNMLKDYVEGKPLASGDKVEKTSTGWSVTYAALSNVTKAKFASGTYTPPATTIVEADLNAALQK